MSSHNSTYYIITGGVVVAIAAFLVYSFWPSSKPQKAIDNGPAKKSEVENKPKPVPAPAKPTTATPKPVEPKPVEVTVEDADESDDEEEEETDDEEEDDSAAEKKKADEVALANKAKYDDANRMATKLIAGNQHARAAEKLSEAIELAKSIASVNKDIPTLYNNRSAMYEKCGEYEKSLQDITVILAMDPNHMKARIRRARVYEALGRNKLALMDYVYGMVVERMRQEEPSNEKKIEALSKKVAAENTVTILQGLRTNKTRALPSKRYNFLYARNLLETFPNFHVWRDRAASQKLPELVASLTASVAEGSSAAVRVASTLSLVIYQLATENYIPAFESLSGIESDFTSQVLTSTAGEAERAAATLPVELLSQCWELKGIEMHLRCYLNGAKDAYIQATRWDSANIDARLKLASIHMELGEIEQATTLYTELLDLLSVVETPPSVPTTSARSVETERGDGTPIVLGESFHSEDGELVSTPRSIGTLPSTPAAPASSTAAAAALAAELISPVDSDDERNAVTANSTPAAAPLVAPLSGTSSTKSATPFEVCTPELISYKAWVLIHRSNTYLALNDQMQYQPDAIKISMRDLDAGLALAESVVDHPLGKAARFIGLMKSVHVLSQTKPLVGEKTTEAEIQRNTRSIAEAAKLFPKHESRLLMEADLLSSEGESDKALKIIEDLASTTLKGDVTPLVMKASFMCTKALISMQNEAPPQSEYEMNQIRARSAEMFQGVESYYNEALTMEPNSLEVLAQYAQFKNMVTGDFPGAVEMLKKAVPLARTRDEALELCQLLVMNESQWAAIQEIQKQF